MTRIFKNPLPVRRFVHKRQGVVTPDRRFGRNEWLVSRGMCAYRLIDMSNIPTGERHRALMVKLRQWSPFRDSQSCWMWHGAAAMVWAWDREQVAHRTAAHRLARVLILPETLLYPASTESGVRLVRGVDGYEGQYWQAGVLQESHWWAVLPTHVQWRRFLRSCSVSSINAPPNPVELPLLSEPWGRLHTGEKVESDSLLRYGALTTGIVLSAWLAGEIGATWRWADAVSDIRQRVEELSERIEPMLGLESEARGDLAWVNAMKSVHEPTKQLQLMSDIVSNAPTTSEVKFVSWEFAAGNLNITVSGVDLEPSEFVTAYEKVPRLADVSATTGIFPDSLDIRMSVLSRD